MTQDADLGTLFDALDDGSPFDVAGARRALDELSALLVPAVPVGRVEDGTVAGVPVRTYVPGVAEDLVLVWAHGGGWVTGTLDAVDGLCRELCVRTGATVVSVDYRLAPEHPFPAALDDLLAVVRATSGRVAVGGDSAGGGLAAAAAAQLRGERDLAGLVLLDPLLDATLSSPSVRRYATGHGLTRDALERCVALYAGGADRRDPRLSPLHEPDLTGLPPTAVVVAGRDPLHDEAVAYAARLRAAGVPVRLRCWEEMVHGFPAMGALTPCAGEALAWAAAVLREGRAH